MPFRHHNDISVRPAAAPVISAAYNHRLPPRQQHAAVMPGFYYSAGTAAYAGPMPPQPQPQAYSYAAATKQQLVQESLPQDNTSFDQDSNGDACDRSCCQHPISYLGSTPPASEVCYSSSCKKSTGSNHAHDDHHYAAAPQQQYLGQQQHFASSTSDEDLAATSTTAPGYEQQQSAAAAAFVPVFASADAIAPSHSTAHALNGHVSWVCHVCGSDAYGHHCNVCHSTRDVAALRVFVGQLCRERAAVMANAMIQTLCGPALLAPLVNIEEHTHPRTGRGKGCVWVYVRTAADLHTIIAALHKRAFVSISATTGAVGFKCFDFEHTTEESVAALCAGEVATLTQEAKSLIHHSPVTAEMPRSLQHLLPPQRAQRHAVITPPLAAAPAAAMPTPMPTIEQQQQQQYYTPKLLPRVESHESNLNMTMTSSSSAPAAASGPRRYRWNPYSTKAARVLLPIKVVA